jgi:hypothetical protein
LDARTIINVRAAIAGDTIPVPASHPKPLICRYNPASFLQIASMETVLTGQVIINRVKKHYGPTK